MFCPNCGYQNADGASFCQNCGTALAVQQAYERPQQQNPPYQPPVQPHAYAQAPRSTHPVLNVVKSKGASVPFLVAAIAFSAAALFSFLYSVSGNSFPQSLYRLASMLDLEELVWNFYSAARFVTVFFAFLGMIPTVLLAVGIWMTYASAANRQDNGMKTAGLTIIKVITIISFVFICIALGLAEIAVLIAVISQANSYFSSSEVIGALIGAMIGIAVGAVLVILYYVKLIQTINTMKMTITTGTPSDRISAYVAVIAMISGVFSVISTLISSMSSIIYGVSFSFLLPVLSALCSATACITFGVLLFSYRNAMRALGVPQAYAQPFAAPAYAPYQNAPQQPNTAYQPNPYAQPTTTVPENDSFVTCPSCGTRYDPQYTVCPGCGQERQ